MKLLLNPEVFKKTLEVAVDKVNKGDNFVDVLEWINTFEKLTGEVFFEKFAEYVESYDKSHDKFFKSIFKDYNSPGVQGVLDNLFKSRNEKCINEAFSALLKIEESSKDLEKFLNRFVDFDEKKSFWSKDEKNSFVTENVFTQKFLSENFYKVGKNELSALNNHKEVFSFFDAIEKVYKANGPNAIPQNVYNLMPAVYDEFSDKLSSSDLLNATYNNFKSKVGDKIVYNYSNASLSVYAKEINTQFQEREFKNEDEYFFKDVLGIYENCYDFNLTPVKASLFSIKSPNAALDFLKSEFSQLAMSEGDEKKKHLSLIVNWINCYSPIKENNELALKPVEFLLEEIYNKEMFELFRPLLSMNLFISASKDNKFSDFEKFRVELCNKFIPKLLDGFCENELRNKSGLSNEKVINLQKIVTQIINNGVSEEREDLYIATVLKKSFERINDVHFNSIDKFLAQDYAENITSLPMDSLVRFMNKDNPMVRYSDIVFDTSGKIFKTFDINSLDSGGMPELLSLAFKVDNMVEEMKTIKFGTSSFFNKVLKYAPSGDVFLSELRNNLDNPAVQSFLEVKTFRAAMSMSGSAGAKETLLNMDIQKKINKKLQKTEDNQSQKLEEINSNAFKL